MKKIFILLFLCFSIFSFASNAIWHWHKNIAFKPDDLEVLARLDFSTIIIHSGSFYLFRGKPDFNGFEFDNNFDKIAPLLNNFDIQLIFTFESWGKHTFYNPYLLKNDSAFDFVINIIKSQIALFLDHGVSVKGIQLDLEGYDVDLKRYAQLLKLVRKTFPNYKISISPMVGWLKKDDFKKILRYIDYYVPMVYDLHRGKTLFQKTSITDIRWIESVYNTCEKLGKDFYIGLPSYYYRIYYNEKNRRVRSWTFVNYEEVSENPAFKLVSSKKNYSLNNNSLFNGDYIYIYRVEKPIFFKYYYFPRGSHLLYDVITPHGLKLYYGILKNRHSKNFKGVCIFRFTKQNEPYLVKTAYYPYIFGDQSLIYSADISIVPLERKGKHQSFLISLKNSGNTESLVNKNGTQLLIKIPNAKSAAVIKNNFDDFDITKDANNNTVYITLTEKFLNLNEDITSGPISVVKIDSAPLKIYYQAWIMGPDGNYHNMQLDKWEEFTINGKNN
ncbi:DUF3142 domain-containing protein [bacterium]|nr:DUF3142 domain-containing protein [bacterium]